MRMFRGHPAPPQDSSSWSYWSWKKYLWQQVPGNSFIMAMISNCLRLFNISEENTNEALCSQLGPGGWIRNEITGEEDYVAHRFGVGHGAESFTTNTIWMVGHYLGDPDNPCITVIDTPGTGDTEGRDCEHGIALAEGIKRIGSIDAFMLLFKGTNARFTPSMTDQIKLYMSIFGREMWQNTITEFTFWGHDKKNIRKRKNRRGGLNEDTKHMMWNIEYTEQFGVTHMIPSVFIDPVYDEEVADIKEIEINKENTDKLWSLLTNDLTTFQCDKRCQAPSGFFAGQPWLIPENAVQNKRLGDRTVITWQIWFAGCDGSGTKSYNLWQVDADNKTRVLFENEYIDNSTERTDQSRLLKGMKVFDEPTEKFKIIRLTIESTEEQHFGSFYIENVKGPSEPGQLLKIVDGEWQEWSSFGPCSKTCISGYERPGTMERQRTCKPPQNGGQTCQGKPTEEKICAHNQGDEIGTFR